MSVVLIGGQSPEEVGMNTPSDTAPEQPDDDAARRRERRADAEPPRPPADPARRRHAVLPTQSREDTDVGWGEYRERDDDDRLLRDRPPHWDNA